MDQSQLGWITNFIWGIADDVLRDLYVRGKYRDVILPMIVLRRLDSILALVRQNLGKRSALGLFAESTVAGNTPLFVDRMLCIRYIFHLLLYYELSSSM